MHRQNYIVGHPDKHSHSMNTARGDVYHPQQDRGQQGTYSVSPSATPWYSDEEDLSPRTSKYYNDLFALYTQRQSADVAPTSDRSTAPHAAGARNPSEVTLFPSSEARDTQPRRTDYVQRPSGQDKTTSAPSHSFFKRHFQKAKAIYQNGPPGEAQMFWEGVKNYRDAKRGVVFEICPPRQQKVAPQKPQAEYIPPNRPSTAPGASQGLEKRAPRLDSAVSIDVSRTSREVPIKLHHTVLTVDLNKPFPRSPPLHPVPQRRAHKGKGKAVDVNKPLPRTPLPRPATPVESPVDAPWGTLSTLPASPTAASQDFARKPLPALPPTLSSSGNSSNSSGSGKSRPSRQDAAHAAFKATISRPIPIPSPSYPTYPSTPSVPHPLSNKSTGKKKGPASPTWRNRVAHPALRKVPAVAALHRKKRPQSDESFGCQGVGSHGYKYHGESVNTGGPRMRVGEGVEGLRPAPLFEGREGNWI